MYDTILYDGNVKSHPVRYFSKLEAGRVRNDTEVVGSCNSLNAKEVKTIPVIKKVINNEVFNDCNAASGFEPANNISILMARLIPTEAIIAILHDLADKAH